MQKRQENRVGIRLGDKGFSLVEMIVTLMLLGLIGVFAGFGLVSGAQSYLSSRDTHSASQTALLALSRIRQECVGINGITFRSAEPDRLHRRPREPG